MEYKKLGEICEFINGDRGKNYPSGNDIIDSGIPFINAGHLKKGKIDIANMNYISREKFEKLGSGKIKENDILYCLRGSLGKNSLCQINEGAIASSLLILRANTELIYTKYLMLCLNSSNIKAQMFRANNGSSQPNLSANSVKQFEIYFPKYEIQIKIAEALDKAQELIDKRKEQIEALDELVKSRFIEMFGDPSKNEKCWEVSEIGKYLNVLTDYHANGSYETLRDNVTLLDTPNYALMVRTTDLEKNNFDKDVKYIDEHAYNHLEKSKVFGGEIIINKIGSAGKIYLMPVLNRPVSLAMNQFMLRFNEDKVNHIFLYDLLSTSYMKIKINEKVRGAVTKTITKDAIREINIIVPPIELQNQFVEFVRQVDKLKFEMEASLKELEDNFNSLMQKSFKGELFQ